MGFDLKLGPAMFPGIFLKILEYISESFGELKFELVDLEVLGSTGISLSEKYVENKPVTIQFSELKNLLGSQDTQLIEFELNVYHINKMIYRLEVRDGAFADVCGTGIKPSSDMLGDYVDMDRDSFFW